MRFISVPCLIFRAGRKFRAAYLETFTSRAWKILGNEKKNTISLWSQACNEFQLLSVRAVFATERSHSGPNKISRTFSETAPFLLWKDPHWHMRCSELKIRGEVKNLICEILTATHPHPAPPAVLTWWVITESSEAPGKIEPGKFLIYYVFRQKRRSKDVINIYFLKMFRGAFAAK